MGIYKGDQNQTGFFYESGLYANASGTQHWIGQVQEAPIDEELNRIRQRYQGTDSRNVSTFLDGPHGFTGNLNYNPQDWKFLMFALGSNVDSGSPSPYTHTISESDNGEGNAFTSGTRCPFMSFGLEVAQKTSVAGENYIRTVNGANVDTLTISASQGEKVVCNVDYIANSVVYSSGAATALTPTTTRPFLWDDCSVEIGATAVQNLISFDWSIANNPDAKHLLNGSKEISSPTMDNREYSMTATVEGNSSQTKAFYEQYFLGGSTFNAKLTIDASTGSRDMILTMSGCSMVDMDSPHGVEGTNEQTLTIEPQIVDIVINDTIELYNPW